MAALSRMLGRNAAYLQQFVRRGSPRRLEERDRRLLAAYLAIDEARLGGEADGALVMVPRIDARAAAGPGALVDNDRIVGEAWLDARVLARLGVDRNAVSMIEARGDSMAPLIEDGDALLVDTGDRLPGVRGEVFVLRISDALMVKRVRRAGAMLVVASDNPTTPSLAPIPIQDVRVIGRVVRLTRAFA
ncbi:helix-turn-helix transcriptional regulator [uncultured Sphingomonas sp.]|uniref:S24 family peptidase n=1 Tax=uncultured Sphingomonas sp. TaxID=158754 RepID=UPI0035C9A285